MNNPGTRLTLQLINTLLREKHITEKVHTLPEFLDSSGNPLFSPSTINRTIKLLEEENWIVTRKNNHGERIIEFTENAIRQLCSYTSTISSTPQVAPFVKELAEQTGESAAFALWQGDGIRFIAKHEMAESFMYIPLNRLNRHTLHNGFSITCLAYQEQTVKNP